jgi:hypothetical protein
MRRQDEASRAAVTSWEGEFPRRAVPKQVTKMEIEGNVCEGWRLLNERLLTLFHSRGEEG